MELFCTLKRRGNESRLWKLKFLEPRFEEEKGVLDTRGTPARERERERIKVIAILERIGNGNSTAQETIRNWNHLTRKIKTCNFIQLKDLTSQAYVYLWVNTRHLAHYARIWILFAPFGGISTALGPPSSFSGIGVSQDIMSECSFKAKRHARPRRV